MRTLVTGGAGFIGSCLVKDLLHDGHEVLVYDNFSTGRHEFLPSGMPGLALVEGDIVDQAHLRQAMANWAPSAVIHLAAIHYIPYCNAHPLETLRVNVEGTQSVIEACRAARVKRLVAASSAAVYPICDKANHESDPPGPVDIYGVSKWVDEILVHQFHQETGVACCMARLFNVFGTNETNPHVIPDILEQVTRTDEIQLGNVDARRDFVYVRDVAGALIALVEADGIQFGVFNVGTGQEYSIEQVVQICAEIVQRPLRIHSVGSRRRPTDRRHLLANHSKITAAVGWQPQYDLRAGLAETMGTTS